MVYIREAHPADGDWPLPTGAVDDPKTLVERFGVAKRCAETLRFTIPMLIDGLDDRVAKAYGAYPDRLWIVGADGRVAYRGERGPFGFRPDEMAAALAGLVQPPRRRRI